MKPYTSTYKCNNNKSSNEGKDHDIDDIYLYDLFCVINHLGEMESGHYTCASRFGEQVRY